MNRQTGPSCILCINAGSSSIKTAVFHVAEDRRQSRVASIEVDGIGENQASLTWHTKEGNGTTASTGLTTHRQAITAVIRKLEKRQLPLPDALGHRIVRSPRGRSAPAKLTPALRQAMEKEKRQAPLHVPIELEAIDAATKHFPDVPQVLCFDNHFFASLPAVARRLPLSREIEEMGVERIGYHGLSYEYILQRIGRKFGRAVIAHLGNGASMAALYDGQPIDTTMGYTPTGGLMMGTRCGDVDPGAIIAVMRHRPMDVDELEHFVDQRCGLAGMSGGDGSGGDASMQRLLGRMAHDEPARQAVESFCYIARKHLGAMIAVLGGIDLLVFTGGIGEHAPEVRWRIVEGMERLGLAMDPDTNARGDEWIHHPTSAARIGVIPTDEDWIIAQHTVAVLSHAPETM